uniref:RNase H type-1 domain-containing protein n=1 Tax=Nicotiana tabacum TaxID=4097 RepID=A0A1S3XKT4_TOBAC|nr:PREDICTED: uncharacterized protein LOC107766300 [Nicotiana tabacum]
MAIYQDVEELLIMGDSDLIIQQAQGEWETRDVKLLPYRQDVEDLRKRFKSIEFRYIPWFHNELVDALANLASMLPYPGNVHIGPLEIQIRERHGYCNTVEVEPDVQTWYHDIKRFLKTKEYPEKASGYQKRTIRRLASGFFLIREVLYKRTTDLNLLRCVDAQEAGRIMNEVHARVCGPHMNVYVLAKIVSVSFESVTSPVQGDRIHAPPSELHPISAPWSFVAWVGATPYLLVYGTEAVMLAEVEITSLRIIVEAEIEDNE